MRRSRSTYYGFNQSNPGVLTSPSSLQCDTAANAGLTIQFSATAPASQLAVQVIDSDGVTTIFQVSQTIAQYNKVAVGAGLPFLGPLAALDGTQSPPCLLLPDGTNMTFGQGWRMWSGTGAPSATTVGTASVGDWYIRRNPSGATHIYRCTVAGTPGTWSAIV